MRNGPAWTEEGLGGDARTAVGGLAVGVFWVVGVGATVSPVEADLQPTTARPLNSSSAIALWSRLLCNIYLSSSFGARGTNDNICLIIPVTPGLSLENSHQ